MFYEKFEGEIKPDNINSAIKGLSDEYPPTKGMISEILNPSNNFEIRHLQELTFRYLEDLRHAEEILANR
ncbi:MAG: hypothetical protein IPM82_25505 [Saprospiraceae bacterium]|nr:hypothetical protein [Saprospiraceae bacterium]